MRINRPSRSGQIATATPARTSKPAVGGFSLGQVAAGQGPGKGVESRPIAAVDALLALQQVPDATAGRTRAVQRAEDMLEILEDIRIGLLAGGFHKSKLARLVDVLEVGRNQLDDPQLTDVLDEIELRARVELAKFGHMAA